MVEEKKCQEEKRCVPFSTPPRAHPRLADKALLKNNLTLLQVFHAATMTQSPLKIPAIPAGWGERVKLFLSKP
jgi:hypothetical protein